MAVTDRQPIRWVRDNIMVTREGVPYGLWAVDGLAYGLATAEEKERVRALHQDLLQALTGEYKLMGLVATTPPEMIIDKMLDGLDDPSEQWQHECDLTYQELLQLPAGERAYFLVVPLAGRTFQEITSRAWGSFKATTNEAFGLPLSPPGDDVFTQWKTRCKAIEGKIPGSFNARRAGIRALRWITHHLTTRGVDASKAFAFTELKENGPWINGASCLPEPLLDEGGLSDLGQKKLARADLFKRRFTKVDTSTSDPSYQSFATMGLTPQAGFTFPGGEFVNFAASLAPDVDFCLTVTSTPAEKARARNRKAERTLEDQYAQQQRAGGITGSSATLDKSTKSLQEYTAALDATDREVEIAATMIFSTAGAEAEWALDDMKEVRDLYTSQEWTLDAPLAGQDHLFWDFWPGSTPSPTAAEYTQITTGRNFSMGIPLANDFLGSRVGYRLGVNITTGRHSPVLQDLGGLAENDISGSFAVVGELGCGKSVLLKTVASHSIDRGARMLAVDHSDNQEWAALARSLTTANVIDFLDPDQSLDPLRIWRSDKEKIRQTLKLITMMLGVTGQDDEYGLINQELARLLSQEDDGIGSMLDLYRHFRDYDFAEHDMATARKIARSLGNYADLDFAATFFDPELPVMDFSAQATVFCTHGMTLPSARELFSESGQKSMSMEKLIGRAAYAYLAAVGTSVMYEDDSQEVLFIVDEAHHMTGSPEGSETILTAIKTGRKHKAAVALGTHSADELGTDELRGLIPQRFVFRTRDKALAQKNLRWLDESYVTAEYIDMITKDTSPMGGDGKVPEYRRGEALYRDHLNRIGKIKVMIPRSESRQHTVLTSPPKKASLEQQEGDGDAAPTTEGVSEAIDTQDKTDREKANRRTRGEVPA